MIRLDDFVMESDTPVTGWNQRLFPGAGVAAGLSTDRRHEFLELTRFNTSAKIRRRRKAVKRSTSYPTRARAVLQLKDFFFGSNNIHGEFDVHHVA